MNMNPRKSKFCSEQKSMTQYIFESSDEEIEYRDLYNPRSDKYKPPPPEVLASINQTPNLLNNKSLSRTPLSFVNSSQPVKHIPNEFAYLLNNSIAPKQLFDPIDNELNSNRSNTSNTSLASTDILTLPNEATLSSSRLSIAANSDTETSFNSKSNSILAAINSDNASCASTPLIKKSLETKSPSPQIRKNHKYFSDSFRNETIIDQNGLDFFPDSNGGESNNRKSTKSKIFESPTYYNTEPKRNSPSKNSIFSQSPNRNSDSFRSLKKPLSSLSHLLISPNANQNNSILNMTPRSKIDKQQCNSHQSPVNQAPFLNSPPSNSFRALKIENSLDKIPPSNDMLAQKKDSIPRKNSIEKSDSLHQKKLYSNAVNRDLSIQPKRKKEPSPELYSPSSNKDMKIDSSPMVTDKRNSNSNGLGSSKTKISRQPTPVSHSKYSKASPILNQSHNGNNQVREQMAIKKNLLQPSHVPIDSPRQPKVVQINHKRYCILKQIGKGGTSNVLYGYDENNTMVAVKIVDLRKIPSSTREEYLNEVKHLINLSGSRSIIRLFNWEHTPTELMMVMEYGEISLGGLIHQMDADRIDMDFIRLYWRQILYAVDFIHKHNIVHTDLKPANFVLVKGFLKLIDFGIARQIPADHTSVIVNEEIGTLEYMAPEALRREHYKYDFTVKPIKLRSSCDVWSLGCILYHLIYRNPPMAHLSHHEKIHLLRQGDPITRVRLPDKISITHQNETIILKISSAAIDVIKGTLRVEPASRYTVDQLLCHSLFNSS